MPVGLEPDRDRGQCEQRARKHERDAADEHVERALAARRQVAGVVHRVPSGASQPISVPYRSQSYRPAASAAVVST